MIYVCLALQGDTCLLTTAYWGYRNKWHFHPIEDANTGSDDSMSDWLCKCILGYLGRKYLLYVFRFRCRNGIAIPHCVRGAYEQILLYNCTLRLVSPPPLCIGFRRIWPPLTLVGRFWYYL